MKIAILGASSTISKDLILNFTNKNSNFKLYLYVRNKTVFKEWLIKNNIIKNVEAIEEYKSSLPDLEFDVIINFVGIGDPSRLRKIGKEIIDITNYYDDLAIDYLENNIKTKYIFMSSGIVSINDNIESDRKDKKNKKLKNHYLIAKSNAERKHRRLKDFSIIDLRIFNYISKNIDLNSSFLIADIFNAVINKEVFKTDSINIYRDFIGPDDFYKLIICVLKYNMPINEVIDCYTKSYTDKKSILELLKLRFGLKYEINDINSMRLDSPSGVKNKYFSESNNAEAIGYEPLYSSLETISLELQKIILRT